MTFAHLFDMKEVFRLEGDGHARDRDIVIMTRTVADVCTDGKSNWFGLKRCTNIFDVRQKKMYL